jgi:predicted Zn-dependent protease
LLTTLGTQAARQNDFPTAIAQYRRALAASPDHLPARANLGNALLVSGRVDEAIDEYRAVLHRNPDDARTQENLARALEIRKSPTR